MLPWPLVVLNLALIGLLGWMLARAVVVVLWRQQNRPAVAVRDREILDELRALRIEVLELRREFRRRLR